MNAAGAVSPHHLLTLLLAVVVVLVVGFRSNVTSLRELKNQGLKPKPNNNSHWSISSSSIVRCKRLAYFLLSVCTSLHLWRVT